MTGIYDNTETLLTPYISTDGVNETLPTAVYINRQDGNGEIQVWP